MVNCIVQATAALADLIISPARIQNILQMGRFVSREVKELEATMGGIAL